MQMSEAKQVYKSNGGHFFDRDTMKYWGSKVESSLLKGDFFITSENACDGSRRYYNVRKFTNNYTKVETVSTFNALPSKAEAMKVIEMMRKSAE